MQIYKDYVAWNYNEMPSLDWGSVENPLQIKPKFKLRKQPWQRMIPDIINHVKEKIEGLLEVGFIKLIGYDKWISNIMLILKKNRNVRICIDFGNMNIVTLKNEFSMPSANMLINATLINEIYTQLYEWSF